MLDFQAQLDLLRHRMARASKRGEARADARISEARAAISSARAAERGRLAEHVPGQAAQTPHGEHWECSRAWEHWRRHGNVELGRLMELPPDLFREITEGEAATADPARWAFLDTETTGLAGGSGTCAFLIGIGRITPDGFRVRQFFMRDYAEEASQLWAVEAELEDAEVLVTYNGKTFDLPLLETRFRMKRRPGPFQRLKHVDLLYASRRLWRLRMESCKLTELESRILGHEREDDIPGELIPRVYFDFVRSGQAHRLAAVFLHNALDIVSLACLAGIVPWAFRDPHQAGLRHGAEFVSLARWLRQTGRFEQARDLFRASLGRALEDKLAYRTAWDLAEVHKKLGERADAVTLWEDLAACPNAHRLDALIELAKHAEHREKNRARALAYTERALQLSPAVELQRRRERLRKHATAAAAAGGGLF